MFLEARDHYHRYLAINSNLVSAIYIGASASGDRQIYFPCYEICAEIPLGDGIARQVQVVSIVCEGVYSWENKDDALSEYYKLLNKLNQGGN